MGNYTEKKNNWYFQYNTHISLPFVLFVYPDNLFMQIINLHGNKVDSSFALL